MATIRRRGDAWVLEWRAGGTRHRTSLGQISKREADRLLRLKLDELQRVRYANVVALPSPASGVPTLALWLAMVGAMRDE